MTPSLGDRAHTRPFDIEAYQELSDRANRAREAFELDAIDRSLDRLLARPARKKSGKVLAGQLLRDARKHLRNTRREELATGGEHYDTRSARPTDGELDDLRLAVDALTTAVRRLTVRQTLALSVFAAGGSPTSLNVQVRQFRNIVTAAHRLLWRSSGVSLAFGLLMDGLDRWRFDSVRLLAPLTAAVTLAN